MVADGAPVETSPELLLSILMDKYGAAAVMGRTLGHNEILCMNTAETITNAYNERLKSPNWATWAMENKNMNVLLTEAMKLAREDGWS